VTWTVILGLTVGQLVHLQNRSYARYAVGVQVATAPLLAAAASLAPAPVAAASLLGLAGLAGWNTLPLMREQHRERFGAWQATVEAARLATDRGWAVVVEPEVHVFSSYLWSELEARGEVPPPAVLSPRAPEPWLGVRRPWLVATVHAHLYMPSLTGETRVFGRVSEGLEPLTQNRFLSAELISNPPLPVGQWWTREQLPDGTPFMWSGPAAELWLPPVPKGTLIGLAVRPSPGDAPLEVSIEPGAIKAFLDGHGDIARLWVRLEEDASPGPVIVSLARASGYPPGGGDDRPLAAQLLGVEVRPPGAGFSGPAATEHDRWALRLEVDGAHQPETFGELGPGVWLEPEARLRLAVGEPGELTLRLASPRPTPANLRFGLAGLEVGFAGEPTAGESLVSMHIDSARIADGWAEIELLSDPYIPSESGHGTDTRSLGVVLLGLSFEPQHPSKGWWSVER
jgi:hypothetical protein